MYEKTYISKNLTFWFARMQGLGQLWFTAQGENTNNTPPQCSCYSHRKPNHHKGYLATPSSSHLCYEFHHFYTFGPNQNPLRSVTTRQKFQVPVRFLVGPEPCELFKACRVHASLQFLDASVQKSKKGRILMNTGPIYPNMSPREFLSQ